MELFPLNQENDKVRCGISFCPEKNFPLRWDALDIVMLNSSAAETFMRKKQTIRHYQSASIAHTGGVSI